jgi:hypothetical protein
MALVPANSYSGQITQHEWIGALDVIKPVIASETVDAYGNDAFMKELMYHKLRCSKKIVNNSDGWSWFDDMRFNQVIVVLANAGTATTNLSFTIGPAAINTLDGQRSVYFAVGDYLMDMATGEGGRINSVVDGGVNFTIQATSITGTNWTAPTTGKEYGIYTYAEFEDSQTLPNPKDSYVEQKSAKLQRFAVQAKATSDVLTDELWINTSESGEYFGSWGDRTIMNAEKRLAAQQVGAMWLGQYTTASGLPVTTRGAWKAFQAEATTVNYTPAGMTISEARDVIEAIKGANAFGPQTWTLPHVTNQAVQQLFQNQGALTDQNINQLQRAESAKLTFDDVDGATAESLMKVFDTTTAILDGVTINVRLLNLSYDKTIFGVDAANNSFIRSGFCAPTARTKDGSGNPSSMIEMGYKSMGKYNLISTYGSLGWLADGGATDEQNNKRTGMRSHMGFGIKGLTQCVYLEV